MSVQYFLVSATKRIYPIKLDRVYVFGREDGCAIPLQDALVSRRHAELRWHPSGCWVIADLNSRNGVLLNGVRISQPTRVDDGTQIGIGGNVFSMHFLPLGGDPTSLGAQAPQISTLETLAPGLNMADMAAQGATFTGEVTGGLLDLLQFFVSTGKSGRLDLVGGNGMASVWTIAGTPVHAQWASMAGINALVAMARTPPPRFTFHGDAQQPPSTTLSGSPAGILMEVARLMDEHGK